MPKNDSRIEAYGTIDELMAFTAYLMDNMDGKVMLEGYRDDLHEILDHLMRLCTLTAADEQAAAKLPEISQDHVSFLEQRIDDMQSTLPAIDKFTLPGGHPLVSLTHICRTVCRRAERAVLTAMEKNIIDERVICYINRLSDYFYILGRKISYEFNVKELYWVFDK